MRFLTCFLLAVSLFAAGSESAKVGRLHVPVWTGGALDGDNKGLGELAARVDGRPAKVLAAPGPADDLMAILVLDFTDDMNLVEIAKTAAIEAIRALPRNATVAVLRAQDGMQVILDPTQDREAAAKAILAVPSSGKAGLLESVEDACRIADRVISKTKVRAAVIYLTDSSITNYREDYTNPVINRSDSHDMSRRFPEALVKEKVSRLQSRIAGYEAPLFIVHLDYRSSRLEEAYQTGLLQLASVTGGSSAFCRSSGDIPAAISSIFRAVASHYSVELEVPSAPSRPVDVELESGMPLTYRNHFEPHP